jgi:hypothetical protein
MSGEMRFAQLTLMPNRIFGGIIENPVLVAAPMFIFMGLVMERTRIAEDLLISPAEDAARGAWRPRARRHADGHDPGRRHGHHRRIGRDADRSGAAHDAQPGLFTVAGRRHRGQRRDAWHPDPAVDHAGLHGGSADAQPRAAVRGGLRAGHVSGGDLRRLHRHPVRPEPRQRPQGAADPARGARGGVAGVLRGAGPAASDHRDGSGLHHRGLGHTDRSRGRRCFRGAASGLPTRAAELADALGAMDGSVRTIAMLFFIFVGATAFAYVFRHIGGSISSWTPPAASPWATGAFWR